MPFYMYDCPIDGYLGTRRGRMEDATITCPTCGAEAPRRPFYLEQGVIGLPTRGAIIPPRPSPRSSAKERPDLANEMLDEFVHESYNWDKKYARGGEYARDFESRPTGRKS